jgi:hypothetical protein
MIAIYKSSDKLVGVAVSDTFNPDDTMSREFVVSSIEAAECAGCDVDDLQFVNLYVTDNPDYKPGDIFEITFSTE